MNQPTRTYVKVAKEVQDSLPQQTELKIEFSVEFFNELIVTHVYENNIIHPRKLAEEIQAATVKHLQDQCEVFNQQLTQVIEKGVDKGFEKYDKLQPPQIQP